MIAIINNYEELESVGMEFVGHEVNNGTREVENKEKEEDQARDNRSDREIWARRREFCEEEKYLETISRRRFQGSAEGAQSIGNVRL